MKDAGEAKIAYADCTIGREHDVSWFQVAMKDPGGVQIVYTVEELVEDGFEGRGRDGCTVGKVVRCWRKRGG